MGFDDSCGKKKLSQSAVGSRGLICMHMVMHFTFKFVPTFGPVFVSVA